AAYLFPIDNYQNFLYAIGSVFIPAYTVVFEDFFLMKSKSYKLLNVPATISFVVGTLMYNYLTYFGTSLSKWFITPTIGTIILTALIYPLMKSLYRREEKIYG
ncbi:MAG: putative hydroxymethylpyrimidine transporter CytX, partial [Thermoanaerobacterium sp.]|nr:putative hydroxymethylpyrimidine transporter CytX [Thermoanaerobacterium sp.]